MKRLLHIGCNVGTESMPKYFREQCDYSEIKLTKNINQELDKVIASNSLPDTIFLQIQSDQIDGINTNHLIGQSIKTLRDRGCFVINWTGDMRNATPQWMIEFSQNVDITMFSNMRDVEYCKLKRINTGFLQQGIDTNIFTPNGQHTNAPDIVFLANNYGNQFPLSGYRRNVANALQIRYGDKFKLYGNGWNIPSGNLNHSQYEEAKLYRSSKIAISISHYNSSRYFSDRLGRSLCSGVAVLSHNYEGIEQDFKVGKHLDTFQDVNGLISKIDYYLTHENERSKLASQGQEYASKEFSYQNIVKQILEL